MIRWPQLHFIDVRILLIMFHLPVGYREKISGYHIMYGRGGKYGGRIDSDLQDTPYFLIIA
jgi:hypothetical protein